MPIETVAEVTDPRLADYADLRHTPVREAVIVEGPVALEQVAGSPCPLRSVLCLDKRVDRVVELVGDAAPIYVVTEEILQATVGFDLHRGVVAAVSRPPERDASELLAGARRVVVIERLSDLENLGALFRNARGLGADAVLLDPETPDPLHRRSVRVSLGHVLRVPFARLKDWPKDLRTQLGGWTLVALTPRGKVDIDRVDRSGRLAFLLGAEGPGLTEWALAAAQVRARIPMAGGVDSLNVATAAALALYATREG